MNDFVIIIQYTYEYDEYDEILATTLSAIKRKKWPSLWDGLA